jgi:sarcosine oxidase subunit beta
VLEKGYIGSGNAGRNTTIVRSNYMMQDNTAFYEHSMSLWRGMSQELNYNVMFSPRGYLYVTMSPSAQDAQIRRANIMRLNGIRADILTREDVMKEAPYLDFSDKARFPIYGAMLQPDAGTARHDDHASLRDHVAASLLVDVVNAGRLARAIHDYLAHHRIGNDVQIARRQGRRQQHRGALEVRANAATADAVRGPEAW